jgi:hypothetical protein
MADIQMSFPIFALLARGGIENLPHIQAGRKGGNAPRLATNARTRRAVIFQAKAEMLQIAHRR